MYLDLVVLVLRETLEASILIGLLLAISFQLRVRRWWIWPALGAGLLGAVVFAWNMAAVSEWFDYMGQEVTNATLQIAIYAMLLLTAVVYVRQTSGNQKFFWIALFMGLVVSLAVTREASELIIFYQGYWLSQKSLLSAITSGFTGLAIGVSAGAVCYYGIVLLKRPAQFGVVLGLIALIAAGMVMQAVQLLVQADWIPSRAMIWDSNTLLPESSVLGQVAYAVFGYEATPSALEFSIYISALFFLLIMVLVSRKVFTGKHTEFLQN